MYLLTSILSNSNYKFWFSLFSYYLKNFANYNKIYGSLGTVIILQIWFYINSLVLLIGFELNASIYYHKGLKEKDSEEL